MSKLSKIGVGLLIVLGFVATWLHGSSTPAPQPKPLGDATVSNYPTAYINGLQLGNNPPTLENEVVLTVGAGANQASWQNTSGGTLWIDTPTTVLVGTSTPPLNYSPNAIASSTMVFYVGTSSTATISNNFARPGSLNPIDGAVVATTSSIGYITISATTTNSGIKGIIPVKNNEYVFTTNQQTYGCTSNGICETATSTTRGFNYVTRFHYYQ